VLDAVDDKDLDGAFLRCDLEAKLFLKGGEDGGSRISERFGGGIDSGWRCAFGADGGLLRVCELVVIVAGEARAIDDRKAEPIGKQAREHVGGAAAGVDGTRAAHGAGLSLDLDSWSLGPPFATMSA